ncbi:hypothetical protein QUF72_15845 [Desulfobacterales bacterium HSG2]|nr:hypothetical protein [Desulfobacterales bacterium HSG2]
MALINRFEVVNFLDSSRTEEWNPDFRHNIFNLYCRSAAIIMTNGTGKTRLVNALLAILSRKKTLISRTKTFMAPARPHIPPTHIRVELILNKTASPYQQQPLSDEMYDTTGESWVMGICGHRGEDVHFYCYEGRLEETDMIADKSSEQFSIISQTEFREKLRKTRSNQFGVGRQDWLELTSRFIPPYHLKQMVEFHTVGGGDKAAELYNIKSRTNERYDQTFFYEHVAPNLLAGVMGPEGDEDEYHFEETIFKSSEKIIAAQFKTREAEIRLNNEKAANRNLTRLVERAGEIGKKEQEYEKKKERISEIGQCLKFLAEEIALPGIPKPFAGDDETVNRLLKHIVIVPGQKIMLRDKGLAEWLRKDIGDINRNAQKIGLNAFNASQIIEIPEYSVPGKGHGKKLYSRSAVSDFIDKMHDLYFSESKSDLKTILDKAFQWFEEHSDTSLFRKACNLIAGEISDADAALQRLDQEAADSKERIMRLEDEQKAVEQGKAAFQSLRDSALFTEDELSHPLKTKERIEKAEKESGDRLEQYLQEQSKFEAWEESWNAFVKIYGDDADPGLILSELEEEGQYLREEIESAKAEEKSMQTRKSLAKEEIESLQLTMKENEENFFKLQIYYDRAERFQKACPNETPEDCEDRIKQERHDLEMGGFELSGEIRAIEKRVRDIELFRERFGKESPDKYLRRIREKRSLLEEDEKTSNHRLRDLTRQREFLKAQKVAPGKIAYDAFDALPGNIRKQFLYEVISEQDIHQDRKASLLTLFSPVLFSPVVTNLRDAKRAVRRLGEKEFPVLVFLKKELIHFLRKGSVRDEADKGIACTFWLGERTSIVECILSPERIEEEKRVISSEIREIEVRLDSMASELISLGKDSPDMILAEKANQAILSDAEGELEEAMREYEEIQEELAKHDAQYDKEFETILSGAKEFDRGGGFPRYSEYKAAHERQAAVENEKRDALSDIEAQIESLRRKNDASQESLNVVNQRLSRVNFGQAVQFFQSGGVSAIRQTKKKRTAIRKQLDKIRQKLRFDFDQAEAYTKNRSGSEQIGRDIGMLRKTLIRIDHDKNETEKGILAREREEMELRSASSKYDEALSGILSEYNLFRQIIRESGDTFAEKESEDLDQIRATSGQLLRLFDDIKTGANDIAALTANLFGIVRQFGLEDQEHRRKSAKKDLDDAKKMYARRCEELLDSQLDGFSQVVKSRIRETQYQPTRIITLHQSIESAIAEREAELNEFIDIESRLMSELIKRLVKFADSAKHNLTILRKVCSKNKTATFDINARVATEEETEKAITNIIQRLQDRHEYAQKEAASNPGKKKKQSQSDLDFIRTQIYRDIFRDPSIKIIHPNIRQGRKMLFSSEVSTGEQSGVALMMMTRLAEFAKMRYIETTTDSYSARRKLKEQEMGFMFIDGLFSTLSNEEVINNSLESLKYVKGNFQLIGFIHNLGYVPNFEIFPTYIVGKKYVTMDEAGSNSSWVENWDVKESDYRKTGTIGTFQTTIQTRGELDT